MDLVVGFELVAFCDRGVSSNGTDVDHPISELDKGAAFNGDIQIRDVMQDEVDERLIPVFANVLNKRLRRELCSQFVGGQPVLCESIIEFIDDWTAINGQLF